MAREAEETVERTIHLCESKQTKGTVVFAAEKLPNGEEPAIRTVYVSKTVAAGYTRAVIQLTLMR